tara:strand:+ start:727 stop:1464 length:738 start_codon:yes stop_codon:yes gene_type:complete
MNKLLIAAAAATLSTAPLAQVSISGDYEGTLTQAGVYTQTLDLKLVGSTPFGSVTTIVDETQTMTDLYATAKLRSVDLTLGLVESVSTIKASTTVGGMTVTMSKPSGGKESLDVKGKFGGIDVTVEDVTRADRETTIGTTIAGLTSTVSYQKTTAGTVLDLDTSTKIGGFTVALKHDKAADDTTSNGGSVSMPLGLVGTVKGGVSIASTDVKTYTLEVTQGILTGKWEKVGTADGVVSVVAKMSF